MEIKQQIVQNNVETQHKHIYLLYIGNLYNIAFGTLYLHRDFTGIHEKLSAIIKIWIIIGVEKTFINNFQL